MFGTSVAWFFWSVIYLYLIHVWQIEDNKRLKFWLVYMLFFISLLQNEAISNFDVSLTVRLSITQSMYQLDAPVPLLFI
jgi:hypothetical protein